MTRLRRLPIRWGLALTSAGLTFAILLLFAVVIGFFTARQVHSNFDDDLNVGAADLQQRLRVRQTEFHRLTIDGREVKAASTGDAVIRVLRPDGTVLVQSEDAPELGPPSADPRDVGEFRVVSRPLYASSLALPVGYVQYGKPADSVKATVAQVKLFLGLGVLAGSGLALLAGLAVAGRAIGPIARLTAAAQEVARTRDPDVSLPKPAADDEVADLARTLEDMLHALGAARADIEAMLVRQREFVADASHELRTPLTSVLANLELLEARLEGEDAEIADAALRSSRRMRRLVQDLLLLARADAGRRPPRRRVDLGDIVREAVAEAAPVAGDQALEVDAPPGILVDGAPDDLHRLALNLIENAISHTPAGTSIQATVRREGEHALLEVRDDGPGVPPELRERVFERFVRGDGDTGARAGSGLGLAIVRAVAESHGGSARLESAAGGGARFTVRLPVGHAPLGPADAIEPAATAGGPAERPVAS